MPIIRYLGLSLRWDLFANSLVFRYAMQQVTVSLSQAIDFARLCQGHEVSLKALKALLMGKILRYQGHFTASLQYLQGAQNITNTAKDLIFVEDASDLACNLADTYLELDDPAVAESCLRAAMKHQVPKQA
ncbi:hypothetical protein ABHI18_004548, partial [Aspergillus niger]